MSNPKPLSRQEAIATLKAASGNPDKIAEWNACYKTSAFERPSLYKANLSNKEFTGVDLYLANLSRTNFSRTDLDRASLRSANLCSANLNYTYLYCTDLRNADLSNTNLSRANLSDAKLNRADLRSANLTECILDDTMLADLDLSQTEGLETVRHMGPSSIGIDTIIKSKGNIPKTFLQGCGVPDVFIEYIPSLITSMDPIQFHSCFISYSHQDKAFTNKLYIRMKKEKLRVWLDVENLKGGRKQIDQINHAIQLYDKLLVVLSPNSMNSPWVQTELHLARQREIKENRRILFPIRLCTFDQIKTWTCFDTDTGKDLAREVREFYVPDFSNWQNPDAFENEFTKLLNDLKQE